MALNDLTKLGKTGPYLAIFNDCSIFQVQCIARSNEVKSIFRINNRLK